MQYLAVSFLRWVVTSCVMWGFPTCQSTPLCAAKFPRVDLRAVAVHRAHPAPLDRRAQIARQVLRVQVAPRDRAEAADPLETSILLDPTETQVPPAKAAAQGPADTPDPVGPLGVAARRVAVDPPAQAARRVAVDPPAQAARREVPGRVAALARRVRVGPLVARALLAHRALQGRPVPAVDHRLVPVVLALRARVVRPVPREVRAVLAHQVALAPPVARDPVAQVDPAVHPVRDHLASGPVVWVQAVLAVARQATLVSVRRAVAVAHVTTNGMESDGYRSQFPIHALVRWDRYRPFASVRGKSQHALGLTMVKLSTQDASKVCNE
jgi:hypothetical protein